MPYSIAKTFEKTKTALLHCQNFWKDRNMFFLFKNRSSEFFAVLRTELIRTVRTFQRII